MVSVKSSEGPDELELTKPEVLYHLSNHDALSLSRRRPWVIWCQAQAWSGHKLPGFLHLEFSLFKSTWQHVLYGQGNSSQLTMVLCFLCVFVSESFSCKKYGHYL